MDSNSDNTYPNVAPMHVILQDALDDVSPFCSGSGDLAAYTLQLSSRRSSTAAKGEALVAIEHVLAETADPRAESLPEYFNALQDAFQCNGASVLDTFIRTTSDPAP